jgi:hypothetical protein
MPDRPEGYLLMSKFYERSGQWQESYTFAVLGLGYTRQLFDLPVEVGYPGGFALEFQQAVAAWWIGRKDESLNMLRRLSTDRFITDEYREAVMGNLERLDLDESSV